MQLEVTGRQRGTLVKVLVLLMADLFGHGNASELQSRGLAGIRLRFPKPVCSGFAHPMPHSRRCAMDFTILYNPAYAPPLPGLFCLHPSTSPLPVPLLL